MWEEILVELLRATVGDWTNTYDADNLAKLLVVSATQVARMAQFEHNFTGDILAVSISPDPCESETLDLSFQNLIVLRAACMLQQQELKKAAGQSISVKDGPSAIDTRGAATAIIEFLKSGKSFCDDFAASLAQYQADITQVAGAAVMGPIRVFAGGHSGQNCRRYFV